MPVLPDEWLFGRSPIRDTASLSNPVPLLRLSTRASLSERRQQGAYGRTGGQALICLLVWLPVSSSITGFSKIQYELDHPIDKHSKTLIASHIELFLNYCVRFYDRQFITRDNLHKDVLVRFETLLDAYFQSDKPQILGLPSVGYCADQLNLSANYFGDLVKKETGQSAQDYIQYKVIDLAKEKIFDPGKSLSEIAYELGFKYPQHFTRLFKQRVGQSPNEYRSLN